MPDDNEVPRKKRTRWRLIFVCVAIVLIVLVLAQVPHVESVSVALFTGPGATIGRISQERPVSAVALGAFVTGIVAFSAGFHWFIAGIARGVATEDGMANAWPVWRSVAIVGIVFLLFVAGACMIGVTHQAAWLLTDPKGVFRPTWPPFGAVD